MESGMPARLLLSLALASPLVACAGAQAAGPAATASPAAPAVAAAPAGERPVPRTPGMIPDVVYPEDPMPKGNPEDVALWKRTRDATNGSMVVLWNAKNLSYRIMYFKYYERLDLKIQKGTPQERERAGALRKRMEEGAVAVQRAVPKVGSMDMHECRRKMLYLKTAMEADPGSSTAGGLQRTRFEAWDCVEAMEGMTRVLEPEVNKLSAVMDEVDAWMPTMPADPPVAPSAPAAAK